MKLSIKDRLVISGLYPAQDDLMTQVLVRDIIKKVEFSQKSLEEIEFKTIDGRRTWNKEKDVDIKFTDSELNLLRNQIDKLDSEKKINQDNLELCLKIKG